MRYRREPSASTDPTGRRIFKIKRHVHAQGCTTAMVKGR